MTTQKLNDATRKAHAHAARVEARLARAYEKAIREAGRIMAANLRERGPVHAMAASAEWVEPDLDELLAEAKLEALLEERTHAARESLLQAATGELFRAYAADPLQRSRITGAVERVLGAKISGVARHIRDEAGTVMTDAMSQGLGVDDAAAMLSSRLSMFSIARSAMIARTEMVGAANAASFGMARETGAAEFKVWIATEDERTRPDHADADGQTVPINEPFDVGGYEMMFPGDENAPAEEVVNCRCTIGYVDEAGASAGGGQDMPDEDALTAAGGASLPLSDRDRVWDAAAAKRRVRDYATRSGKLDLDTYASAFLWRSGSTVKLPFADVIDGKLTAVWAALQFAASARVDIPASDAVAVKLRIADFYARAAEQYGDAAITPPWQARIDEATSAAALVPESVSFPGVMQFVTIPSDGAATEFRALLAPIDEPTSDGRILSPAEAGAISWRNLPLPLMWQSETADGHDGAVICGRIDSIEVGPAAVDGWSGEAFVATGAFDDGPNGSPAGADAARLARDKTLRGVSIDLAPEEVEMRTADNQPLADDADDATMLDVMMGGGIAAVTRGKIMGATITPFPAFEQASIEIVASLAHADLLDARMVVSRVPPETAPRPDPPEDTPEDERAVVLSPNRVALSASAAEGVVVLVRSGLATPNEGRSLVGLTRIVGGDELLPMPPTGLEERAALAASVASVHEALGDRHQLIGALTAAVESLTAAESALAASAARIDQPPRSRSLRVVRDDAGRTLRYEEELTGG